MFLAQVETRSNYIINRPCIKKNATGAVHESLLQHEPWQKHGDVQWRFNLLHLQFTAHDFLHQQRMRMEQVLLTSERDFQKGTSSLFFQ